jgi:hypothetical protein
MRPHLYLLLVVSVFLGPAASAPGLVCESRAAAVALGAAAAGLDAAVRFAVDLPPPGGPAGWDTLLVEQAFLVAADDAPPPPDALNVRALLWPTAPLWRPWPLVAWASAGPATANCAALVAAGLDTTVLPNELYAFLHALNVYETSVAATKLCPDASTVPAWTSSGNLTCVCAPDKDCDRATVLDATTGVLWALAIVGLVLALALNAAAIGVGLSVRCRLKKDTDYLANL